MNTFQDCPEELVESFSSLKIGIIGAGGIGSNTAMLLVRAGARDLVIADFDVVESRNLNRQFFFTDQIGMKKVSALEDNLIRINSGISVSSAADRITRHNLNSIFSQCDILIEAVDSGETKAMIIEEWSTIHPDRPVVSCSGIAGTEGFNQIRTVRSGLLSVVGDMHSELDKGTFSARVMAVASAMVMEIFVRVSGSECRSCSGCSIPGAKLICNGEPVPLSGFPARIVESTVRGMLGSLKGADPKGSIRIELDQIRS